MKPCQLCGQPRAYTHLWWDHAAGEAVRLCSERCVNWWTRMHPNQQAELNRVELEAVEASLPDVGRVVAEIGGERPFNEWTREEALRLIFTAVRAAKNHTLEIIAREEIPPWQ